jgi:hypothetical protein
MTSDREDPLTAPESQSTIVLRIVGLLGLLFGTAVGGIIGGWWWLLGLGIFIATALIAASIEIVRSELGKRPRRS